MTTNSQPLTTKSKKKKIPKQKQSKQTTRTGTESQKWRSPGGLSKERGRRKNGEKGTGKKKHNWQAQNRQGEIKNSVGNGEAKEFLCTTHGHELRVGGMLEGRGCRWRGDKEEQKMG